MSLFSIYMFLCHWTLLICLRISLSPFLSTLQYIPYFASLYHGVYVQHFCLTVSQLYLSVALSHCLSVSLSLNSAYLSNCISTLFICFSVCLSLYSAYLSNCISALYTVSASLSISLSLCLWLAACYDVKWWYFTISRVPHPLGRWAHFSSSTNCLISQ